MHATPENSGELLDRYRGGDDAAAEAIFARYTERLLALARSRLSPKLARRIDADDVLQSTYRSFFLRARDGEFAVERDGDLWRLLATITLHKLGRQAHRHRAAKRSLDRDEADSALPLAELASREPSPVDVVIAAEELHRFLSQLEPDQRDAVRLRLEGRSIDEIAHDIGRSDRTIRRWLAQGKQLLEQRRTDESAHDGIRERPAPREAHGEESVADDATLRHDDYRLERLIGSGGICKVYAAIQKSTGRRVAVKALRKRLRRHAGMIERFLNEARIVAGLSHPHIVPVHGVGRLPDGGYFMVMDFIDGENLAQQCARGLLSAVQAASIVLTVAEAIAHAHHHGVVHRDLKPGNVLLDRHGTAFVTDFGFAWLQGESRDEAIVGTAAFMAPEQVDRRFGEIGPRTDIYGLGALLYMLLYGRPPLNGATTSDILAQAVARSNQVRLPDVDGTVPPELRGICERCLQPEIRDRYSSAHEVAEALRSWQP